MSLENYFINLSWAVTGFVLRLLLAMCSQFKISISAFQSVMHFSISFTRTCNIYRSIKFVVCKTRRERMFEWQSEKTCRFLQLFLWLIRWARRMYSNDVNLKWKLWCLSPQGSWFFNVVPGPWDDPHANEVDSKSSEKPTPTMHSCCGFVCYQNNWCKSFTSFVDRVDEWTLCGEFIKLWLRLGEKDFSIVS